MDAVDAGHARVEHFAGDGLVGGEHELFDEIVGLGGTPFREAHGIALGIQIAMHLGQGEIERAVLEAQGADFLRQLSQRHQGIADFLGGAVEAAGIEERLHHFIGEAGAASG